ncbi:MAG: pyridoxal-phosphate dependent enzyme [Xanthomonadales bacterium]|nr:L-threo-3-hydroxyaspartate ammonia-lyase [Xanthomonadales bacterium]MCC6594111.1 pyridoxal-phosphate dependent enzyme [Xanthomonadales bacterium]MCE7931807.1 pyridoxal-phosphate dependent enzyme [Xanthomonadales bacterium PRO6]
MVDFPAPTFDEIRRAAERIAPYATRTPVLRSRSLNAHAGADIHFKCENFQRIGAFKFRGACNAVFALDDADAARGVATHSSGNHAAALALAAQLRGIPAQVVMPEDTVRVKVESVRRLGAQVEFCEPTNAARVASLAALVARTGAVEVHPYAHPQVIAGQGTASLELIDEIGRIDALVAPISGGGLLAGNALAARALCPTVEIFGAEPEGADDALRSFACGQLQGNARVDTICDGLRADLGARNFAILRACGAQILGVPDCETLAAMRLIFERLKIVVEPSAAITLAAVLRHPRHFAGKRVGLVLSGGNVDLDRMFREFAR